MLLRGRQWIFASSAFKVGIATEVTYQPSHELIVLGREHLLLDVGEATSKLYRSIVAVILTVAVLATLPWIDKMQEPFCLYQSDVCQLM